MKQYPYEGIVVFIGTAMVMIPLALGLKYLQHNSPIWFFVPLCGLFTVSCLLIARRMDKQAADRERKAADRSRLLGLDLHPSEWRDLT